MSKQLQTMDGDMDSGAIKNGHTGSRPHGARNTKDKAPDNRHSLGRADVCPVNELTGEVGWLYPV